MNGLRSHTRGRFAEQGEQIDELTAALDATRRAAASKEFPTAVAGLAFAAGALLAGAGWFFAPRGALRATLGEKKPSASQIESIKDAA